MQNLSGGRCKSPPARSQLDEAMTGQPTNTATVTDNCKPDSIGSRLAVVVGSSGGNQRRKSGAEGEQGHDGDAVVALVGVPVGSSDHHQCRGGAHPVFVHLLADCSQRPRPLLYLLASA